MKHWAVLIFFLMFCVSCKESLEWEVPDPRCEKFYSKAGQICRELGVWIEDKRCMTEWDRARHKCKDKTAPDQCRGFYDKAKQFCKNLTGDEFGNQETKCGKKLTEATRKCMDSQKSFFQTLFGGSQETCTP